MSLENTLSFYPLRALIACPLVLSAVTLLTPWTPPLLFSYWPTSHISPSSARGFSECMWTISSPLQRISLSPEYRRQENMPHVHGLHLQGLPAQLLPTVQPWSLYPHMVTTQWTENSYIIYHMDIKNVAVCFCLNVKCLPFLYREMLIIYAFYKCKWEKKKNQYSKCLVLSKGK